MTLYPECDAPSAAAKARGEPASPAPTTQNEPQLLNDTAGERRQLTVLFCDLADSTAKAAELGAENWRYLVRRFHKAVAEVIARHGGYVAKNLGDGVLVYFGWPTAHDDDPERAARAGLGIVEAVKGFNKLLSVRIGLDTGPVVIADGGEVYGDTANIAARVQALADPDMVLATAATNRLVAGLFIVEDKGAQVLKGVPRSIQIYRIVRPSGVRERLAAAKAAAHTLTPFVGREDERRLLRSRFEQACKGEGQVVVLVGEAGIGKSRLAQMLHEDLIDVPHTWLEARGQRYFADTPFHAITELLKQFFAWRTEDTVEMRAEALARALEVTGLDSKQASPLMAALLDLPVPADYPPVLAPPDVARKRLVTTLAAWALANARLQPLVILLEDLHWVDASTVELMQLLVDQDATVPLLLLFTTRPEFRFPWPLRAHDTQIRLRGLPKTHTRTLVEAVAARAALAPEIIEAMVARTDGVPLFAEELTRAVVEEGAQTIDERAIPMTLQSTLMARLDRLGPPAKEVAQVASVIGREFSYLLLQAVARPSDAELRTALAELIDTELVYARGLPPEATYIFKHALVQETAYESLLKSRRRELHDMIATALIMRFPTLAEVQPEVVARHWTQAGNIDRAVDAWQQAGERAGGRSAFREAAEHLGRGLALLQALPEGPDREQRELLLQLPHAVALALSKGNNAPEADAAIARAGALAAKTGSAERVGTAGLGLWAQHFHRGELAAAHAIADEVLSVAQRDQSQAWKCAGCYMLGTTQLSAGDVRSAHAHLAEAVELFDPEEAVALFVVPGSLLAAATWHMGFPERSDAESRAALTLAMTIGNPVVLTVAYTTACIVFGHRRDARRARPLAEECVKLATQLELPIVAARGAVYAGWAATMEGRYADGIAQMRQALDTLLATGSRISTSLYSTLLAEAYLAAGAYDDALRVAEETLASYGDAELEATDLHRLLGDLFAQRGDASGADAELQHAITLARRCGSKMFELRAAASLARLLQWQGKPTEARALLAPIYARFSEGFDTRDLTEAQALLNEL